MYHSNDHSHPPLVTTKSQQSVRFNEREERGNDDVKAVGSFPKMKHHASAPGLATIPTKVHTTGTPLNLHTGSDASSEMDGEFRGLFNEDTGPLTGTSEYSYVQSTFSMDEEVNINSVRHPRALLSRARARKAGRLVFVVGYVFVLYLY